MSDADLISEVSAAQLAHIEAVARKAGAIIQQGYRQDGPVEKKGTIDLVTEFDVRAEQHIVAALPRLFPGTPVVAEEGGGEPREGAVFYVDPLDGTTNFAHGHPFFCVSIGLCHGREPIAGVIFAPALDCCWKAARGVGAFRNDKPCSVTKTETLIDTLGATGFPYDRMTNPDNNLREHHALLMQCRGVRRCGSAALDLALVADGTYDFYWERGLKAWDMCGGAALVLEAGGQLSDYDGGPADPRSGRLVASNSLVHAALLQELATARAGMDVGSI